MKILIVGLGSIGKKHVDAILSLYPSAQIFALRSVKDSEPYRQVINIYNKQKIPEKLTFIIIATITSEHEAAIHELMEFNCPLFIEKPVLSELNNAVEISGKLQQRSIVSYVACNLRFHPSLQFVKDYLDKHQPRINEVNIYCGSYLPDWRPNQNYRTNYSAHVDRGGGAHLDLIHEIDYCSWLFGFPDKALSVKTNTSSLTISAVDQARFIYSYPLFTVGITLNYFRRDAKRQLEIITDTDTLIVDLLTNTVQTVLDGKILFHEKLNMLDTYKRQIKYFIDCIQSNIQPMNDFDYSIKVLKLAVNV